MEFFPERLLLLLLLLLLLMMILKCMFRGARGGHCDCFYDDPFFYWGSNYTNRGQEGLTGVPKGPFEADEADEVVVDDDDDDFSM